MRRVAFAVLLATAVALPRTAAAQAAEPSEAVIAWVRVLAEPGAFLDARAALVQAGAVAIPPLIEALADPALAPAAVFVLVDLPRRPEQVVPALIEALASADPDTRRAAATALGSYGPDATDALSTLEGASRDPDPWLRLSAADAMARIAPEHETTRASLARLLEDPDRVVRSVVRFTQARIDPEADPTPAFLVDLVDPDDDTRRRAAVALAALGRASEPVERALVSTLDDPEVSVWAQAVSTLSALQKQDPPSDSLELLLRQRLEDTVAASRTRLGALFALLKRGERTEGSALPIVERELAQGHLSDESLRWLTKLTSALPEIRLVLLAEELTRGTDPQRAWEALVEFEAAGPRAAPAVPVLIALLDDPELRPRAILALTAIGPAGAPARAKLEVLVATEQPAIAKLARRALEALATPD